MLFELVLTRFFSKVNCFYVYRKLTMWSTNWKGLLRNQNAAKVLPGDLKIICKSWRGHLPLYMPLCRVNWCDGTPLLKLYVFFIGFTLLKRLLAISNLLSKEEVKQIKFLAKSKISNDRLAQISKAFEVFEALEKDGKFPISYITKLLVAVKRDDLVVKLKAVPLTEEEEGQGKFQFNGLLACTFAS